MAYATHEEYLHDLAGELVSGKCTSLAGLYYDKPVLAKLIIERVVADLDRAAQAFQLERFICKVMDEAGRMYGFLCSDSGDSELAALVAKFGLERGDRERLYFEFYWTELTRGFQADVAETRARNAAKVAAMPAAPSLWMCLRHPRAAYETYRKANVRAV